MKKIFIYYSLTGSGDLVADTLKSKGYDIRKVVSKHKYPKSFFWLMMVGGFRAGTNKKDKLIDSSHSQKLFDLAPVKDKSVIFVADVNHHDIYFKEINNPIILDWLQKFNIN